MKTDDTIDFLEDYCEFGEDRVYLLMAIARAKENPSISSNSEPVLREVVKHEADIQRKYEKLRAYATQYRSHSGDSLNFRLYITVNARNTVKTYFNFRERMNGWTKDRILGDDAASGKFKRIDSHWKSELHRDGTRDETLFLFDLDDATPDEEHTFVETVDKQTEIITRRQTPNGYHVITVPFNYNDLATEIGYELKTDGMLFVTYLTRPNETKNTGEDE
jgi:hypothetical protein